MYIFVYILDQLLALLTFQYLQIISTCLSQFPVTLLTIHLGKAERLASSTVRLQNTLHGEAV